MDGKTDFNTQQSTAQLLMAPTILGLGMDLEDPGFIIALPIQKIGNGI